MQRPRILVSRCLLGDRVRHDGDHRRLAWLTDQVLDHVEVVGACPEVEMGLGVPRAVVELRTSPAHPAMVRPSDGTDLTELATATASRLVAAAGPVDGAVLKARSPSCGVADAPVVVGGLQVGRTSGLFAAAVVGAGIVAVTDEALSDEDQRRRFVTALWRRFAQRTGSTSAPPPALVR